MTDDQSETAVLRQCLLYAERHKLEATLTLAQRDERCMRRAVFLMGLFTALGVTGLCYSALFLSDFPRNKSHLALKLFGALGLGSLISLLAFAGFWTVHRKELAQRREECRLVAAKLVDSPLSIASPVALAGLIREPENLLNRSEAIALESPGVRAPKAPLEANGLRTADLGRTTQRAI